MAANTEIARRIADIIRAANEKYAPEGVHPDTMGEVIARELGLVQFWSVAYGDGYQAELSWENWDEARDHAAEGPGTDFGDSKIITGWFTGWHDAPEPVTA